MTQRKEVLYFYKNIMAVFIRNEEQQQYLLQAVAAQLITKLYHIQLKLFKMNESTKFVPRNFARLQHVLI